MKITVRVFTMLVVFAGLALASVTSANVKATSQPSSAFVDPGPLGMPVPQCGPGIPTCPQNPPSGGGSSISLQ